MQDGQPFGLEGIASMSVAISPTMERPYGVERVCSAWEAPRSTFYAQRAAIGSTSKPTCSMKRGPKPLLADETLLTLIREDQIGRAHV